MKNPLLFAVKAVFILSLFGCLDLTGEKTVFLAGIDPPKAAAGQNISIFGSNLNAGGTPTVTINGAVCTIVSVTEDEVVVTVPAGASSGDVLFANAHDNGVAGQFVLGTPTAVAEIEPNDDINGANATLDGNNRIGTGNLANVGDKDHFRFQTMATGQDYKITVTPAVVGVIYVNGTAVTLDGTGSAVVRATNTDIVVGLTGGTGDYSLTVTRVP